MTMGERLKEERLRIGVNQTVLAEKCGVTKNTQLAYEKGERNPDTAYLAHAFSLGIDILYLVTGERKPLPAESISAADAQFLSVYKRVSEADRDVLLRMVSAFAQAGDSEGKKERS